ncbi:MAG: TIGR00730 family Rossman fold protein [Clostridia bacterium]|nr:TIGR00730 family Rossman fold protein [Clostridia bacterium]
MNVCLYGASSNEIDPKYIVATEALGEALALAGHGMVYGAGSCGLMGAAARGMTRHSGHIVGVVPEFLNVDGILYDKCDEMVYTETMRQRKQIMEERSDAFIVTPGGIGTYEEFFEIYTLKQLGRHQKPIILYNIDGFFDRLYDILKGLVEDGFMRETCLSLLAFASTPNQVLAQLNEISRTVDATETKYI